MSTLLTICPVVLLQEAISGLREKEPLASSTDYGQDGDRAVACSKKHETVMADIETYSDLIASLRAEGDRLIEAGHPDSARIAKRQAEARHRKKNREKKYARNEK